jgi:hypothetical protein
MTLQIRLDKKTRLGDLAKDLIIGFETVLRSNKQPVRWGHRDRTRLIRTIRSRLAKMIQAFPACGEQARCHTASVPLHPDDFAGPIRSDQHILLLKASLPILSLQLEEAVFERFYPLARDSVWLPLKPELDQVVAETLEPVLYQNAYCHDCPHCPPEARESPWTLKRSRGKK